MPELRDDPEGGRSIVTARLILRFHRVGDRWTHALELPAGAEPAPAADPSEGSPLAARLPLVWAVEGDPTRDELSRVVSPAYRAIHFSETPATAIRATLSGDCGPHAFEATFDVWESDRGATVQVNVRHRTEHPIEATAATYWVDARSSELIDADGEAIRWAPLGEGRGELTFSAEPPARVDFSEAGRRATRVQASTGPSALLPGDGYSYTYSWIWAETSAG